MWIDLPHNKVENYLQHYVKGKKENPASTSAVIIIPRWQGGSHWRRHSKGMYLIKEYPANTPLKWVMGDGTHPRSALPCPNILQVWFDPRAVPAPLAGWPGVKSEPYTTLDSGSEYEVLCIS